jgi:sugar lactone lactonase YvrE
VSKPKVLHEFAATERGIEGICVAGDGTVVAVGGSSAGGAGALVYVFSAAGALTEKQPAPADAPMRCAFGDADLGSLYMTTAGGHLYRSKDTGLKGARR